ncbi:MAG TPA: hypothetical protein VFS00_28965 [Polyangiaceae bacterium]|nr:hypothetical protein [Polyangiaceae bacterium]
MGRELLYHLGTTAEVVGPKQLRFENRGAVVTALITMGFALAAAGVAAASIAAIVESPRSAGRWANLLLVALPLAGLVLARRLRRRSRGVFVLDGEARTLRQEGGPTWPLERVSFYTRVDLTERNLEAITRGMARWVVADVKGGPSLLLCKGHRDALGPVVAELGKLGLEVR